MYIEKKRINIASWKGVEICCATDAADRGHAETSEHFKIILTFSVKRTKKKRKTSPVDCRGENRTRMRSATSLQEVGNIAPAVWENAERIGAPLSNGFLLENGLWLPAARRRVKAASCREEKRVHCRQQDGPSDEQQQMEEPMALGGMRSRSSSSGISSSLYPSFSSCRLSSG